MVKKIDIFPHIFAPVGPKKTNGWLGMITEVVDSLDITPDERRAIYEGNARRILKLK